VFEHRPFLSHRVHLFLRSGLREVEKIVKITGYPKPVLKKADHVALEIESPGTYWALYFVVLNLSFIC